MNRYTTDEGKLILDRTDTSKLATSIVHLIENCSSIDNIAIERFWRTLKYEDVYPKSYKTLKEARDGINEYINIYNSKRIHSAIDYNTPDEVYDNWKCSCNNITEELLQSVA